MLADSDFKEAHPNFVTFGKNVRGCRISMGITMKELADLCQISMNTLARIQRGEPCFLETQKKLADAFEIRLESLWRSDIGEIQPYCHHKDVGPRWSFFKTEESRKWPLNDSPGRADPDAIQDQAERLRLGRNGFSSGFICIQRSLLENGLYTNVVIELYTRLADTPMPELQAVCYRGLRGGVRFLLPGKQCVILQEDETLLLPIGQGFSFEPEGALGPHDLPPLMFGITLTPRPFNRQVVRHKRKV